MAFPRSRFQEAGWLPHEIEKLEADYDQAEEHVKEHMEQHWAALAHPDLAELIERQREQQEAEPEEQSEVKSDEGKTDGASSDGKTASPTVAADKSGPTEKQEPPAAA